MAALAQSKGGYGASDSAVVALDSTSASGNLVVVWVFVSSNAATTVTDNKGNTYPELGNFPNAADGLRIACHRAWNIVGGSSHQITAGISGVESYACVQEWSGFGADDPGDKFAGQKDTVSAYTSGLSGTLAQADELLTGFISSISAANDFTAGGSFTKATEVDGSGESAADSWLLVSSTTSVESTWTSGTADGMNVGIGTFKLAASDPSPRTHPMGRFPVGNRLSRARPFAPGLAR